MNEKWYYLYSICPICGNMNQTNANKYPYLFYNEGYYDIQCHECGYAYKGNIRKSMISGWTRMELNNVK